MFQIEVVEKNTEVVEKNTEVVGKKTEVVEKNTHSIFSIFFLNCDVYWIMWQNAVVPGGLQIAV
jgi:hypothetical protein